ncbi:MAG: TM0996/MTH895 family glutaredoxin-like protein [Acholeplasmataceae bacterium]|nr:TM0996/MTH895 family glutaredoxin-like protein [Acholeplasmataceae bacterium]
MEIKVLGSGCANCKRVHQLAERALKELNIEANLLYVTDMMEIADAGILRTPGLVINNKIVSYGRIPTLEEVKAFIQNT